jgi:hypothetical protein
MRFILGLIVGCVLIGSVVGLFAYQYTQVSPTSRAAAQTAPTLPAGNLPTPTPRPFLEVDGVRKLWSVDDRAVRLMVNEGAFLMQQDAFDEADSKKLGWVWKSYSYLDVEHGTAVKLLKIERAGVHVEIMGGPKVGLRGWVSRMYLGS